MSEEEELVFTVSDNISRGGTDCEDAIVAKNSRLECIKRVEVVL